MNDIIFSFWSTFDTYFCFQNRLLYVNFLGNELLEEEEFFAWLENGMKMSDRDRQSLRKGGAFFCSFVVACLVCCCWFWKGMLIFFFSFPFRFFFFFFFFFCVSLLTVASKTNLVNFLEGVERVFIENGAWKKKKKIEGTVGFCVYWSKYGEQDHVVQPIFDGRGK